MHTRRGAARSSLEALVQQVTWREKTKELRCMRACVFCSLFFFLRLDGAPFSGPGSS